MFNVFTVLERLISSYGELDDGIGCTLMKFANEAKLSGEVHILERRAILQEDLDGLE